MIVPKYGIQLAHVMRTHAQMFGVVDTTRSTGKGDNRITSDDDIRCDESQSEEAN